MIQPVREDVHVYKRGRRKAGVDVAYFRTPRTLRRESRGVDDWLIIEFEEGGKIEVPVDGVLLWVEPNRH